MGSIMQDTAMTRAGHAIPEDALTECDLPEATLTERALPVDALTECDPSEDTFTVDVFPLCAITMHEIVTILIQMAYSREPYPAGTIMFLLYPFIT
jgi:hypothetical protein